jgi:hypothetical protein
VSCGESHTLFIRFSDASHFFWARGAGQPFTDSQRASVCRGLVFRLPIADCAKPLDTRAEFVIP